MIHRYVQRDKKNVLSQETIWSILKRPIITEKATAAVERRQYMFEIAEWATKWQVTKAVEAIFSVKVLAVNTLNVKGKNRVFKGKIGKCSDKKKAIVSLEAGYTLDFERGVAS